MIVLVRDPKADRPVVPIYLEVGTRRVFACSVDWPGWCRSGKGVEAAIETLAAYGPRYRAALLAGGVTGPGEAVSFEVVEEVVSGTAADFGTLHAVPEIDRLPLAEAELSRLAGVVRATWTFFDAAVAGAPPSLRKGPRGGGRDRDAIAAHVVGAEVDYARRLGVSGFKASWEDPGSVASLRAAIAEAIAGGGGSGRSTEGAGGRARPRTLWPPRTGARRVAWHVLDHAWEIEDKTP